MNGMESAAAVGGSASERPWTTDDVRKSSHHWTLAGDAALLTKLQDMAHNLVSMTHKVQQEVDSLTLDTSCSHSKLGNVINEFLMLSNTQFVENRVYDEEMADATPAKKEPSTDKTTEEHRTQIVEKVSKALRLGMSVLETDYEQLDVQNSDSEEEGETVGRYAQEPILRPKDPYRGRPLPCLIGSSVFLEDDHVGLQKPVFSDDDHVEEDVESDSSVEDMIPKNANVLPKDYSSEDEVSLHNGVSRSTERHDSEKSGGSDLFDPHAKNADNDGSSSSVEEGGGGKVPTSSKRLPKTADFRKELSDKLRPNRRRSDSENDASVESVDQSSKLTGGYKNTTLQNRNSEDFDGDNGEDDGDDDELFAPKRGLFSVKAKLFDNSGDEEDLFFGGQSSKKKTKGSDSRDSSHETNGDMTSSKPSENLFDDVKDSDSILAGATPAKRLPTRKDVKVIDSLFDEVDHDSLFEIDVATKEAKPPSTPTKKVLPGAVSMFGGSVDPLSMGRNLKHTSVAKLENKGGATSTTVPRKKNSVLEDDDVGRPGSGTSSQSSRSVSSSRDANVSGGVGRHSPAPSITSRSSTNLFAEEPEVDDLFSTAAATKRKPIGGISLFDGDDNDDDGDDIFAPKIGSDVATKKTTTTTTGMAESEKWDSSNSFFDDILAQIVKPRESSPKTSAVDLFDDIFVSPASKERSNSGSAKPSKADFLQEVPTKPLRKVSLFDDDDGGAIADDLFGSASSSTKQVKSSNTKSSSSLPSSGRGQSLFFEDHDESLLFGDVKQSQSSSAASTSSSLRLPFDDDNLEVDLFQQSSKMKKDTKTAENKEDAKSRAPSSSSSVSVKQDVEASASKPVALNALDDDDDDDDDLFATKKDKKDVVKKPDKIVEAASTSSVELPLERRKSDDEPKKKKNEVPETKAAAAALLKTEPPLENLVESPSRKKPPVGGVALFSGVLTTALKPKATRNKSAVVTGSHEDIKPTSGLSSVIRPGDTNDAGATKAAVDFDKPVSANPLHNATKERIKISVKRRPSTRRGRQEALRRSAIEVRPSGDDDDDDNDTDELITEAATISAPTSPVTPDPDFTKELFKREDDRMKKSTSSLPSNSEAKSEGGRTSTTETDATSEPIGSSAGQSKSVVGDEFTDSDDGLFGLTDKKSSKSKEVLVDSLSSSTSTSTKDKSMSSGLKSGDDLFSSKPKSAKVDSKPDDSSSLFGTSGTNSATSKLGRGKSLFDDDDDEDDEDIFKPTPKKTSSSSSSATKSSAAAAAAAATRSSSNATDKGGLFEDPLMVNKNDR